VVYLMWWKSQGPLTLLKMVPDCGAPKNQIRSDNAPEFKGRTWMTWPIFRNIKASQPLQKHTIQTRILVNIAEVLLRQS
jgi:hypothetical protein